MGDVSAEIVIRFASAARDPGRARDRLAALGLGADASPARPHGAVIAAEVYYELLEEVSAPDDHALPFRYAASLRPEDFNALGLALKTATDVGEALERIVRYVRILSDTLEYELRDVAGGRAFVLCGRPGHRRGARLANEGALAATTALLRDVAGGAVQPRAVRFRHAAPSDASPHRAYFASPVAFEAAEDALVFDDATLGIPCRLGDDGLSAFLLAQLDALAARQGSAFAPRVRRSITALLCDGPPSRDSVARRLGMSERTLHRRLRAEGVSYRELLEQARHETAAALLTVPRHSLAEVAFLTGFSDQSAFTRAFKRWSGMTPAAFRERAGSE